MGTLLVLPFFFGGHSYAADDLLRQLFQPAKYQGMIINMGENVNTVGNNVFKGSFQISEKGVGRKAPLIVRITQLLLKLTIALSVTMILYNGLSYIIQTGQGKESKSLVKNVILIVVGILVALFSVVIITLIQSVLTTLEKGDGTSTIINKGLNIQHMPTNKKSHYDTGDILTGEVRIWANGGDFSIINGTIQYSVPRHTLEFNKISVKKNTNGLTISENPETTTSGDFTVYTWDLPGGAFKEGTEDALLIEIGSKVIAVSESADDYVNEACLLFKYEINKKEEDGKICFTEKDNPPEEKIGKLSEENRKRLKENYNINDMDELEAAAKKYFEDRYTEPYTGADNQLMVNLRGVETYMINAYLSEIWE